MPKRKMNNEEKIMKYEKKIRRLQQKNRRRSQSSDSSSFDNFDKGKHTDSEYNVSGEHSRAESHIDLMSLYSTITSEKENTNNDTNIQCESSNKTSAIPDPDEPMLDDETLQALGDPIQEKPKFGANINVDLAKRCFTILKNRLDRDAKEALLKNYLIPENCQTLQAPMLNPEIVATISDNIKNRDRKIEAEQQQLGQGITALNRALSLLVTNTSDRFTIIKTLSDSSKILTDLHCGLTVSRRKLVTPVLDKKFLEIIKDIERDEFLYGGNLSDKIKAMKNAQKSGQTIKKTDNFKPPPPRRSGNFSGPSSYSGSGNFRGPPRYQTSKTYNRGGQKRSATERNPSYKQHHYMRKSKAEMKPAQK